MGDGPNIPWRLLDIIILVQDKETGGERIQIIQLIMKSIAAHLGVSLI